METCLQYLETKHKTCISCSCFIHDKVDSQNKHKLSQPGNIQSNTEWNLRQHKITIDQNAHIILQRLQSKKCVENNLIKVYLCVRGIYFASFYEFDIWVWNSDSVGCVFFILLIYWTKRFRLLLFINHFSDHRT
jgi:hypothetical protein